MNFGICTLSIVPVRSSASDKSEMVAVDQIGAGIGDEVIITKGHNAVYAMNTTEPLPIDAVIVGIID